MTNILKDQKQIVGIYANCQGVIGLRYYLEKLFPNWEFVNLMNYTYIRNRVSIDYAQLKKFNIFIYQPLREHHGIYSTSKTIAKSIINMLDKNCIKISFPYIYNDAMWPLASKEWDSVAKPNSDNIHGVGVSGFHNSEIIFDLLHRCKKLEDVKSLFLENKIDFKFEQRFKKNIEKLREKEKDCDIKITDFVLQNYRKQKLFFTKNHPTSCIFKDMLEQILHILNIQCSLDIFDFTNNNLCNLHGEQPHSNYEVDFFKFTFDINIDTKYYLRIIEKIASE